MHCVTFLLYGLCFTGTTYCFTDTTLVSVKLESMLQIPDGIVKSQWQFNIGCRRPCNNTLYSVKTLATIVLALLEYRVNASFCFPCYDPSWPVFLFFLRIILNINRFTMHALKIVLSIFRIGYYIQILQMRFGKENKLRLD